MNGSNRQQTRENGLKSGKRLVLLDEHLLDLVTANFEQKHNHSKEKADCVIIMSMRADKSPIETYHSQIFLGPFWSISHVELSPTNRVSDREIASTAISTYGSIIQATGRRNDLWRSTVQRGIKILAVIFQSNPIHDSLTYVTFDNHQLSHYRRIEITYSNIYVYK